MGTAWAQHAMCESAFNVTFYRIITPTLIHTSQQKELSTEERLRNIPRRSVRKYVYNASVLDASFSSLSK
jgi:hypothetical protein